MGSLDNENPTVYAVQSINRPEFNFDDEENEEFDALEIFGKSFIL